jgi:hypothetical protein
LSCKTSQPSKGGFQAIDVGLIYFYKTKIFFRISYTSYLEGSYDILSDFVYPLKPLFLKGGDDDVARNDVVFRDVDMDPSRHMFFLI